MQSSKRNTLEIASGGAFFWLRRGLLLFLGTGVFLTAALRTCLSIAAGGLDDRKLVFTGFFLAAALIFLAFAFWAPLLLSRRAWTININSWMLMLVFVIELIGSLLFAWAWFTDPASIPSRGFLSFNLGLAKLLLAGWALLELHVFGRGSEGKARPRKGSSRPVQPSSA